MRRRRTPTASPVPSSENPRRLLKRLNDTSATNHRRMKSARNAKPRAVGPARSISSQMLSGVSKRSRVSTGDGSMDESSGVARGSRSASPRGRTRPGGPRRRSSRVHDRRSSEEIVNRAAVMTKDEERVDDEVQQPEEEDGDLIENEEMEEVPDEERSNEARIREIVVPDDSDPEDEIPQRLPSSRQQIRVEHGQHRRAQIHVDDLLGREEFEERWRRRGFGRLLHVLEEAIMDEQDAGQAEEDIEEPIEPKGEKPPTATCERLGFDGLIRVHLWSHVGIRQFLVHPGLSLSIDSLPGAWGDHPAARIAASSPLYPYPKTGGATTS